MKKNWYAVYTKLNCELRVSSQLSRKKIENLCPVNNLSVNTGFKRRWTAVPLFQQLVFVRITEAEMQLVKQTGDVVNFLFWLGGPAQISDEEIRNLERFANDYNQIKIEKTTVNPQLQSQITSYSHKDNMSAGHTVVKMLLPSLGFLLMALIETATVKVIDPLAEENKSSFAM
ncbi:transcription termination/antitermination NusG family protein [Ferruginibacter paludis]|uniref:transcription termination/antitermination NusG family protein n=1 Tax=Ferruginibacter paludis TaxID=1310417 RepID=UPI0025B3F7F3|nr:transcription termination/antitermination NusG family protein [Ferruginibacter paludis]MDN3655844.1 transcription termination/antitermination NusG family protein [Ferruginibacter paludis]